MKAAVALTCAVLALGHARADETHNLTLLIRHVYGDQPLAFNSGLTNTAGDKIEISRLSYLLSEPGVKENAQAEWLTSHNWFAFVDATKGDASRVLDQLPAGNYHALQFSVGLLPEINASDPSKYPARHALNPNVNGLHWGWAGGYVFLALEGHHGDGNEGFSYHLAGAQNRMEVTLPVQLDLTRDATVELDFHADRLFAGTNPIRIAEQNSTHSRDGDTLPSRLTSAVERAFSLRAVYPAEKAAASAQPQNVSNIGAPYTLTLPRGVPVPDLPVDFGLTNERVALGRALFHDTRLSVGDKQSCASCHDPAHAFADAKKFSLGANGTAGNRNAMPLFNLAWKHEFFWDGHAPSIRKQIVEPITRPDEMNESFENVVVKLSRDEATRVQFAAAFGSPKITSERIGVALESFLFTLTSFESKFDRAMRGESQLNEEEKRGFELFVTEYDPRRQQFGADCFHCHGGALFTDNQFHNNGLGGDANDGRARVTHLASDNAKFITPSLRNVALTAPYMHDGRFATLAEVIEHYDHGVTRSNTLDPNIAKHPAVGLGLSAADKQALVAFLETLTDERFGSGAVHVTTRAPEGGSTDPADRAPFSQPLRAHAESH